MNVLELKKMPEQDLKDLAKRLKVDLLPNQTRTQIEDIVEVAVIKREKENEAKASAELQIKAKETLKAAGIKEMSKEFTSPEGEAIKKSKKVYALFRNVSNPGNTEMINKGCMFTFTLWDGRVHILPEWLIKDLTRTMSGTVPQYATKPHPVSGEPVSYQVGVSRKFVFEVLGDAPEKSEFGVILDQAILDKFGIIGNQIETEAEIATEIQKG